MLFQSRRIAMFLGLGQMSEGGRTASGGDQSGARGEALGSGGEEGDAPVAATTEEDRSSDEQQLELDRQLAEMKELHLEIEAALRRTEQEHEELERQLMQTQKLEGLGVLAGGIAHDFNNLLMAISGNLELIKHVVGPESPATRYIDNAFIASKRAADLARQMLAYPRKGVNEVKPLDLNRMVGENADLLKASVLKGVKVTAQLQPDLPLLEGDPAHLQQLVINLITNAAEAMGEGGGNVKIATGVAEYGAEQLEKSRLEQKQLPGRYLYLEVADNGCGMDGDTIKRIFDPFFSTKLPGRGLGLTAVQGIVRRHGGAIFVDSEPGAGTTFSVLFPLPLP